MKKATIIILLAISFMAVFAGDVVKVLQIYSGGKKVSIPVSNIDSLNYSMFNEDGTTNSDYTTSLAWTIDSVYQIPLADVDSMILGEIDVEQYKSYVDQVIDYISSQGNMEVETFQKKFLEWLHDMDIVQDASINDNRNMITITFANGLSYFVDFQDLSFFTDDQEASSNEKSCISVKNDSENKFIDVSKKEGEVIIESPNVLFVQCRQMNMDHFTGWYKIDNDVEEKSEIEKNFDKSPVKLKNYYVSKDLQFLGYDWSLFGLILISQTHGAPGGGFEVEDKPNSISLGNEVVTIYYKNGFIEAREHLESNNTLYFINPKVITSKLKSSNATYLGNYCYSFDLARNSYPRFSGSSYTIVGNTRRSNYRNNLNVSTEFTEKLFSGITTVDAAESMPSSLFFFWNDLLINNFVHKRYFSISTDEITKTGQNGQPIISGKINGYENLKKDELSYLVYCREGEGYFTPEVAKDDECMPLQIPGYSDITDFEINDDGSFSFEYPGLLKSNTKYELFFAFEYKDIIYYGETRYIIPEEKDETITEGELVDLGLSVKWASCNVGADKPSQLGIKTNIDILTEAYHNYPELFNQDATYADFRQSEYDLAYKYTGGRMRMPSYDELKELREKCTWELSVVDGIAGVRIMGPNKNSIFLPAISTKSNMPYYGDFYTMDYTTYTSGTYDKELGWGPMCFYISGTYVPKMDMASILNFDFSNDFEAFIRPVGR